MLLELKAVESQHDGRRAAGRNPPCTDLAAGVTARTIA